MLLLPFIHSLSVLASYSFCMFYMLFLSNFYSFPVSWLVAIKLCIILFKIKILFCPCNCIGLEIFGLGSTYWFHGFRGIPFYPEAAQLLQSIPLLSLMPDAPPPIAQYLSQLPLGSNSSSGSAPHTSNYHYPLTFISTLMPICTSCPIFFAAHLVSSLTFLPALISPPVDCGSTLWWDNLSPGNGGIHSSWQGVFVFPPPLVLHHLLCHIIHPLDLLPTCMWLKIWCSEDDEKDDKMDECSTLRLSALEFMIGYQKLVRKGWISSSGRDGWVVWRWDGDEGFGSLVKAPPALYEQASDCLACAMGGRYVLPPSKYFFLKKLS